MKATRFFHVLTLLLILGGTLGSSIKSDEVVTFFPKYAVQTSDGQAWLFHFHGWVYEPEDNSFSRNALIKLLADKLGISSDESKSKLFQDRARLFVVDNERGKDVEVRIGGQNFSIGPSESNGHIVSSLKVPDAVVKKASSISGHSQFANVEVVLPGPNRNFFLTVPLLGRTGVSVISDIDDTIKISEVASRRALLANTFFQEFRPVEGMADLYGGWSGRDVAFHYVSASPWQLFPSLRDFIKASGFPEGSLTLKTFRWKDSSFFDLFAKNDTIKHPFIDSILDDFPERKFILVGDTGELDARLYARIARDRPSQIAKILIRNSTNEDPTSVKWKEIFKELPSDSWCIFSQPAELTGKLAPLL